MLFMPDFEPDYSALVFPGKQEEERVLYIVRPHWVMFLASVMRIMLFSGLFMLAWYSASDRLFVISESLEIRGYILIAIIALVFLWWRHKYYKYLRAYVTDIRLVRFEAVFPITEKRRALFWRDVTKTRGIAPNVFWRALNLGTVEISPLLVEYGGNILLPCTYYFEDLAAYMDKIIHNCKEHPEKMPELRPFILKPKGQRYPEDTHPN